jgi:hypothetical protein
MICAIRWRRRALACYVAVVVAASGPGAEARLAARRLTGCAGTETPSSIRSRTLHIAMQKVILIA